MKRFLGSALLLCSMTGLPAFAEQTPCERPEAPVVPDGSMASQEDLAAAGTAVRAFIQASQDYLACLEAREEALGEDITPAQQTLINAIYNGGVEAMEQAAEAYNAAIRAFRAREES